MSFDPKGDTRAAVLAGSLASAEIAPTPFHLREHAAIIRAVRSLRAPLDLDAGEFRYIVKLDGTIRPVRPVRRLRSVQRLQRRHLFDLGIHRRPRPSERGHKR
jgi:hypothetical protein